MRSIAGGCFPSKAGSSENPLSGRPAPMVALSVPAPATPMSCAMSAGLRAMPLNSSNVSPRIHDAVRIEARLHAAHQLQRAAAIAPHLDLLRDVGRDARHAAK